MAEYDVIVIGSGAGGLAAACTAAVLGKSVLIVEASQYVGGTTAVSGGMMWIPCTEKAQQAGYDDSLDKVETYLGNFFETDDPRLQAFLLQGDRALRFLEQNTALKTNLVPLYPDYRPEFDGATSGGRVVEPVDFDGSKLGGDFRLLRPPLPELILFGGMMISRKDMPILRKADRSLRSALHAAKLVGAFALDRIRWHRGTKLVLGNALAARLFKSARDLGVTILTQAPVESLVQAEGRVIGVRIGARPNPILARHGVILATGGISHSPTLRQHYVPHNAGGFSATIASNASKSGAALARDIGARLSEPTVGISDARALWVPVSIRTRPDGTTGLFPHTVSDRAKPGLIAVNQDGRRFVNEAISYHDFVRAQLEPANKAIPAWLICDGKFLWRYGLGSVLPFSLSTKRARQSGYLYRSNTIRGLAEAIGLPAHALDNTVNAFNAFAKMGKDPEFRRGEDAYQRHMGDPDHLPNPCVAPIERAPFYAVAVHPADLGMAAGVVTDADARALGSDGMPIAGLYAVGNDMESVMQGAYPGPGITIGPAIVFGYLASTAACKDDRRPTAG